MVSLKLAAARFEIPFVLVENGAGIFHGVLNEASQDTNRANIFTEPRRTLRVRSNLLVQPGMVVRAPSGEIFIVADNGASDVPEGTLWNSFKLFRATQRVHWVSRGKRTNPVTLLPEDGPPVDRGMIWATIEPVPREAIERRMHVSLEQAQFIAGAPIQRDDTLDGRPVMRSDNILGVRIGNLT